MLLLLLIPLLPNAVCILLFSEDIPLIVEYIFLVCYLYITHFDSVIIYN
jgi:hypothetical protein